jgi:hypothetical protein
MAMETGGSIGFPVGDTYVFSFIFFDNKKQNDIF